MQRDDLLKPGQYASQPLAVMARGDLSASAKLVYAYIVYRIGKNPDAWPGCRRMGKDLALDPKTALASVARLKEAGLITVEAGGIGRANHYRISAPENGALQKMERSNPRSAPRNGAAALQKMVRKRSKNWCIIRKNH